MIISRLRKTKSKSWTTSSFIRYSIACSVGDLKESLHIIVDAILVKQIRGCKAQNRTSIPFISTHITKCSAIQLFARGS